MLFPRKAGNPVNCCKSSVEKLGYRLAEREDAVNEHHTQIQCAAGFEAPIVDKRHQQTPYLELETI